MAKYSYIGKSVPRLDARDKAAGTAIFSSDIRFPGILYGKCKRCPHPFAKILNIDASQALKLPGVRAVITARNVEQTYYGEFVSEQLPLCDQYARYIGDEVAAVAAVDEDIAEEALDLIEVEYEVLNPVFDPEKALEPGAPAVHPELETIKQNTAFRVNFERGKGEAGFKHAATILEDRFTTQPMHQGYMQTRDCVAQWNGGRLTLWAVIQSPFRMRAPVARAIVVPEDYIRVIPGYVGGGFGNNAIRIWPIATLLAREAGKPVKMVLTRAEDFISGRPFPSAIIDMKMGFKRDGIMVAKKMDIIVDAGAYIGSCIGVTAVASGRADNLYRLPNIKTSCKLVFTNNTPHGSLRGYGTQLTTFALECMVDMAAAELGLDPTEIRLKNASHKGDTTVHGFILNSCGLDEAIKLAAEKTGWAEKRKAKDKNYGIGLANATHVSGPRIIYPVFEGSSALVQIDQLGKVRVFSGELEIGQGSDTVFAQITAEELGINIEDIKIIPVDTDVSPFAKGTFGDRITALGGAAVRKAAIDARTQLLNRAAEILKTGADKLELKNGKFFQKGSPEPVATLEEIAYQIILNRSGLPVIGQGDYTVPDNVVEVGGKQQYYGNYSIAYTFLTQIADVCVDRETGKVDVRNVWSAIDLGKAVNPKMCEGQIKGGVTMGLGYALSEDYIMDKGRLLNPGFTDYKMYSPSNTPPIHSFFIETIDPTTPYGLKAVGEAVGDPTAAVIANAVYNAIGVRIKDLPITPEKILKALKEQNKSHK